MPAAICGAFALARPHGYDPRRPGAGPGPGNPPMQTIRILSWAASRPDAQAAVGDLRGAMARCPPDEAEVIVALGGDGFMLQTLHAVMDLNVPVYGMNRGSVGFLMNDYVEDGLPEKLANASSAMINPLRMVRPTRWSAARGARHQRGGALPPDAPGGEDAHDRRRHGDARRAGLRRHPGGDAGGLDRLQSPRTGRSCRSART